MFYMSNIQWFTDEFDVYRVVDTNEGGITKHERKQISERRPCRVYNNPTPDVSMQETAATVSKGNTLICDIDEDIRTGDEIIVYRSSRIREKPVSITRYFAGAPNMYVEPFGGAAPHLEHIQVSLMNEERID